jgi:riboflavin synthase
MFTGLIEEIGTVTAVRGGTDGCRLVLSAPRVGPGCALGDSISVNGVCLTLVAVSGSRLEFDAIAETLRRSNLGELRTGDLVNLERAMAAGDRFGGHLVQGHVDTIGRVVRVEPEAGSHVVTVEAGPEFMRYVVEKGSVALDGISLTVAAVSATAFSVAIIPHTWAVTNISRRRPVDSVNLEADLLAKYVERLIEARLAPMTAPGSHAGLTEEELRHHGFA